MQPMLVQFILDVLVVTLLLLWHAILTAGEGLSRRIVLAHEIL